MNHFRFGQRFSIWTGVGAAIIIVAALAMAAALGLRNTSLEDHPLEIAQEIALVAAVVVFAWSAIHQQSAGRMASIGAAVVSAVFYLRELELQVVGPVTDYLNSGSFRLHEAALVVLIAVPYIVLRWRLMPTLVDYVRSRDVWPFATAAILLIIADRLDGHGFLFGIRSLPIFIEELFELLAYYLMMCAGIRVLVTARKAADESSAAEPLTRH
ncbi:hypothetical protein L598_000600001350 [Mesorhizobium sp. J18]|uniref:hypothetical protein n=1 Tax=Mesorhizobium sp. J18 TaxID=935263 RepID=UPI00119AC894|nr:hypothetical protein [Mesorhizobium sp. J18]TWG91395.1 hypothetical protein L598_000600001350 [Mesorhizobium sp. J18]